MLTVAKYLKFNQKGFTLIELLIVITVIGVLAVAVLSAINPIEQINKANDARRRSDTAELLNSVERYFSSFGQYPWGATAPTTDCPSFPTQGSGATGCSATVGLGDGDTDLDLLISNNELKAEFANRALDEYAITENTTTSGVHVCFLPVSQTWNNQANFNLDGTLNAGCPDPTGTVTCYVCVPE